MVAKKDWKMQRWSSPQNADTNSISIGAVFHTWVRATITCLFPKPELKQGDKGDCQRGKQVFNQARLSLNLMFLARKIETAPIFRCPGMASALKRKPSSKLSRKSEAGLFGQNMRPHLVGIKGPI
jgi:hypothetical protein